MAYSHIASHENLFKNDNRSLDYERAIAYDIETAAQAGNLKDAALYFKKLDCKMQKALTAIKIK